MDENQKPHPSKSITKSVMSKHSQATLEKKVPIRRSDKSMFDDEFTSMKRKFANEMRRIEAEMTRFSTDLVRLTGETTALHAGVTATEETKDKAPTNWDVITKSPLVEGEGDDRVLKLQFDVSQFHPDEVTVRIVNDVLFVTAIHKERTDHAKVLNEFNREFKLPKGTDPETVKPSIDKDGVLTIEVPLSLEYNIETPVLR